MKQDHFKTNTLIIAAAFLLSEEVTLEEVTRDQYNPRKKIFYFAPYEQAYKLYQEYIADRLSFSPQQLSLKINTLKDWPVAYDQVEKGETEGGPIYGRKQAEPHLQELLYANCNYKQKEFEKKRREAWITVL